MPGIYGCPQSSRASSPQKAGAEEVNASQAQYPAEVETFRRETFLPAWE